jgi:predicted transcriptional regulator
MTERINARLEPELAKKLAYLRRRTGKSTTEIVRESLESYYERVRRACEPASALADFIGSAEGPADLSETYKAELSQSLRVKSS